MSTTDPTTEQMRQETGHDCICCPSDVRNLAATAHNLLVRLDAARQSGEWGQVFRKAEDVRKALELIQTVTDEHFAALDAWRRP